jgi:hypothetical protein
MTRHYLDIEPVLCWLDREILPQYESIVHLARTLSARSGIKPKSWERRLMRLRSLERIEFFALDSLCAVLGEHVSRFCDLDQFAAVKR